MHSAQTDNVAVFFFFFRICGICERRRVFVERQRALGKGITLNVLPFKRMLQTEDFDASAN